MCPVAQPTSVDTLGDVQTLLRIEGGDEIAFLVLLGDFLNRPVGGPSLRW